MQIAGEPLDSEALGRLWKSMAAWEKRCKRRTANNIAPSDGLLDLLAVCRWLRCQYGPRRWQLWRKRPQDTDVLHKRPWIGPAYALWREAARQAAAAAGDACGLKLDPETSQALIRRAHQGSGRVCTAFYLSLLDEMQSHWQDPGGDENRAVLRGLLRVTCGDEAKMAGLKAMAGALYQEAEGPLAKLVAQLAEDASETTVRLEKASPPDPAPTPKEVVSEPPAAGQLNVAAMRRIALPQQDTTIIPIEATQPQRWDRGRLVCLAGMACLILATIGLWYATNISRHQREPLPAGPVTDAVLQRKAEALLERFLAADSVASRQPLVVDAPRVLPLMEEYYSRFPHEESKGEGEALLVAQAPFALPCGAWQVDVFVDREDQPLRCYFVEFPDGRHGEPKLDWESSVIYNPHAWDRFVAERPAGRHQMRVAISRGDYHNYEFSDATGWSCWRLRVPGYDETLYGYTPRHALPARQLDDEIPAGEATYTLIVEFPKAQHDYQTVLIREVVQRGWRHLSAGRPHSSPPQLTLN